MAYIKQNWENSPSKISPLASSRLNHMEDGIYEASQASNITGDSIKTALGYTPYDANNPEGYTSNEGTITEIKMNGETKGTEGSVDLGNIITSVKTINNESIVGDGNININAGVWGGISGNIQNQEDLKSVLDDKASKDFVNSSIATSTGTFKGTFTDLQELLNTPANSNDYAIYDETSSNGSNVYNRYKYDGTEWKFEYALNSSSFTQAQWDSINSGVTSNVSSLNNDAEYIKLSDVEDNFYNKLEVDDKVNFTAGTIKTNTVQEFGEAFISLMEEAFQTKQDELVSGTNIKTINNQSILGEGNIDIEGGEGSGAVIIYSKDSDETILNKLKTIVVGDDGIVKKPAYYVNNSISTNQIYPLVAASRNHFTFYREIEAEGIVEGYKFTINDNVLHKQYIEVELVGLSGTSDPTENTEGYYLGQTYVNTTTGEIFYLKDWLLGDHKKYYWEKFGYTIIYSDDSDEVKINKFKSCLKETGDSNVYEMIKPCFIYDNGKLTPIDMFSFSNGVYAFSYKIYYSDAIATIGLLFEEEGTTITEKESISPNANYIINDSTSDKNKIEIISKNSNVKWRIQRNIYENVYNDTITRDMYKETTIKYARYNPENESMESFDVVYRKDRISPTESTETITRSEIKTLNLSNSPVIIYETDSESVMSQKLLSCISLDEYNYPRLVKPCKIFGETDIGTFSYETTGVKRKNGNIEFQFKMEQVVLESDEPLLYISIMKIITDTNGNIIDNQRKIYASALQELE